MSEGCQEAEILKTKVSLGMQFESEIFHSRIFLGGLGGCSPFIWHSPKYEKSENRGGEHPPICERRGSFL